MTRQVCRNIQAEVTCTPHLWMNAQANPIASVPSLAEAVWIVLLR